MSTTTSPAVEAATAAKKVSITHISAARVRRRIDKMGINLLVTTRARQVKAELAPFDAAESRLKYGDAVYDAAGAAVLDADGKPKYNPVSDAERAALQKTLDDGKAKREELSTLLHALARERARFSNEASQALAVVLDELVRQLAVHAMDNVLAEKKKIIQVGHLRDGASACALYPLVHGLPSWHQVPEWVLKKKKDESEEEQADATVDESSSDKTSFVFYVSIVCKNVIQDGVDADGKPKKHEKYGDIRVSTNIREYCNLLLCEFLERLGTQLQETLRNRNVKTITEGIIMEELCKMLIDGQRPSERLVGVLEEEPDPVAVEANRKLDAASRKEVKDLPKRKVLVVHKRVDYTDTRYGAVKALVDRKLAELNPDRVKPAAPAEQTVFEFSLAKPAPKPAPAPAPAPAPVAVPTPAPAPVQPEPAVAAPKAPRAHKPAAPKDPAPKVARPKKAKPAAEPAK